MLMSNSIPVCLAAFGYSGLELIPVLLILVVMAIPSFLAFSVLNRVPVAHQRQKPGYAFLLMIPIFSLVWGFFVHPKVAESLQSYFAAQGDTTKGDCGAELAKWLCILSVCSLVPILGILSGLAALVLLILFYVKAFELVAKVAKPLR